MDKDFNRIKVVLADKKRTNKWLAKQLGKDPATVSNGVPILPSQALRSCLLLSNALA